jgi:hypothetical protein
MKIFFFVLSVAIQSFTTIAQNKDASSSIVADQPYYINDSGQMIPLEKSAAKMSRVWKSNMAPTYVIEDEHALVSFSSTDTVKLSLNTSKDYSQVDPAILFHIYHLNINNGKREAIVQQQTGYGKKVGNERIAYQFKASSEKIVFTITEKLPPGEYAIINMLSANRKDYSVNAFCFRIE